MSGGGSSNSKYANSVFYATSYHPIQAGSIDGTDILPHDNAVYRAVLCSSAGLYDPFGDPKLIGDDPYCTLFVGHLSHFTTEDTLRQAMSKYGRVKNLRLIRHIVTGASRGYAFVEYESEREMLRAYEEAHHSIIDDCEIIVDYNRQQLMSGWIPRRLGGGIGGKKESGQLRFGGRERPFRAPLRPIPFDDLKRLGIPPPPEGQYLTRYQVPSPPRRRSSLDMDEPSYLHKRHKHSKHSHRHERRSSSSEDHLSDSKQSHQHESRKSNSEDHSSDSKHSQRHGRRMSSTKDYPSASKHYHQHERRRSRSKDHLSSDSKHSHRYERRRSSSDTSDSKYSDRHEQRRSINEDHPSASKHSKRHERRRSNTKDHHPSDSRHSHQHERRRPSSKDEPSDSKDSHQHER